MEVWDIMPKNFTAQEITVKTNSVGYYVPPMVFKGDPVGHIGEHDCFYWLIDGTFSLFIDKECYIMQPGQLAFLPKGQFRKYTNISEKATIYTMRFSAKSGGENLMKGLGCTDYGYVVTIADKEEMTRLFESFSRIELQKSPIDNVIMNSNILSIISRFYIAANKQYNSNDDKFSGVIQYMKDNINREITIENLTSIVHMSPTYFIRQFKKKYNASPLLYFKGLRINKAIELLVTTETDIKTIATTLGIEDISYFSRWFKKSCGISPSEYRKRFS